MDKTQLQKVDDLIAANRARREAARARLSGPSADPRGALAAPAASTSTAASCAPASRATGMRNAASIRPSIPAKAGPAKAAVTSTPSPVRKDSRPFLRMSGLAAAILAALAGLGAGFAIGFSMSRAPAGPALAARAAPPVSAPAKRAPVPHQPWTAPTHVPTGGVMEPFPYTAASRMPVTPPPAPPGASSVAAAPHVLPPGPVSGPAPGNIGAGAIMPRALAASPAAPPPVSTPMSRKPYGKAIVRLVSPTVPPLGAPEPPPSGHVATVEIRPLAEPRVRMVATPPASPALPPPVPVPALRLGVQPPRLAISVAPLFVPVAPRLHWHPVPIAPRAPVVTVKTVHAGSIPAPSTNVAHATPAPASPFVIYRHVSASGPLNAPSPFGGAVRAEPAVAETPAPAAPESDARAARPVPAPAVTPALSVIGFPSSNLVLVGSRQDGRMLVSPYQVGQKLPDGSTVMRIDSVNGLVFTDRGTLRLSRQEND